MPSKSIHAASNGKALLFFMAEQRSTVRLHVWDVTLLYGWAELHCVSVCVRCCPSLGLSSTLLCVCVCEMLSFMTEQHSIVCLRVWDVTLLYGWAELHCASVCVRCCPLWLSSTLLCVCVCEMLLFFRTEQHSLVRLRVWDVVLYDWAALHCVSVCVTISSTIISWWTLGLFPYLGNCECAINIRVHVSFQISFRLLLDIYPGVEFLGHTVILFLVFWETTILFSTVTVPV